MIIQIEETIASSDITDCWKTVKVVKLDKIFSKRTLEDGKEKEKISNIINHLEYKTVFIL